MCVCVCVCPCICVSACLCDTPHCNPRSPKHTLRFLMYVCAHPSHAIMHSYPDDRTHTNTYSKDKASQLASRSNGRNTYKTINAYNLEISQEKPRLSAFQANKQQFRKKNLVCKFSVTLHNIDTFTRHFYNILLPISGLFCYSKTIYS